MCLHSFLAELQNSALNLICGEQAGGWQAGVNNLVPDCKSHTFWDVVMKLHTLTPQQSRMCPIDFVVQRSRSWGIDDWKWFPDHNWLCNPPVIIKLHTIAPHESRMCPVNFGKSHRIWFPNQNYLCIPPMIMKLQTPAPYESLMCPIDFGVKGLGLFGIENSQGCYMFIQGVFAFCIFDAP